MYVCTYNGMFYNTLKPKFMYDERVTVKAAIKLKGTRHKYNGIGFARFNQAISIKISQ